MDLILPVKKKWFDLIKSGKKTYEYRIVNSYWYKRLVGKEFDRIIITLGYPKRDDIERRLVFPWNGYTYEIVICDEWAGIPQKVFAIKLCALRTTSARPKSEQKNEKTAPEQGKLEAASGFEPNAGEHEPKNRHNFS